MSLSKPSFVTIFLVNPEFLEDIAEFLGIKLPIDALFTQMPLERGDSISNLLTRLKNPSDELDELFMEVVGELLRTLRAKQSVLEKISGKRSTIEDLAQRMILARHFVEANYREVLRNADVAAHAAISEFHFSRLLRPPSK